ncbi:MAG: hypothetical protein NTU47_15215 [Ignavibacteriales bacterium]|nr:hypothetical protein [Ignavibacteriales bacterium]
MNYSNSKIALRIWIAAALGILASVPAFGQEASTSQTLTLQVFETNRIDVSQRAVTMVINQASLETGNPVEAVNEDGNLTWITNGDDKKITVASNNSAPRFLVKVHALDITGSTGVAAPEITLSDNTTRDLVVGVTRSYGKCKIRFVAAAKVSDGIGTETHVITYTVTGG